jgi:uracil phosphoribosyltransferase
MVGAEKKNDVVLVPAVRAGVPMVETAIKLMPFARVGYFGMQMNETTAIASTYYQKLPPIENAQVILLDPMLTTGGSADYAIQEIGNLHPKSLSFCCIVAAPEGLKRLTVKYPDIHIYIIALDQYVNEKKFIVPGLSDFRDRYQGTDF